MRLEEAALNATAVSAQVLHDGWLVRFAPSAAKRVRSINVLGLSTRPLDERLAYCSSLYARRGLPMLFRLTSIGPDFSLDDELAARYALIEETRVMSAPLAPRPQAAPAGLTFAMVDPVRFADEVGRMRGALPQHVEEHRARLAGWLWISRRCWRMPATAVAWLRDWLCAMATCWACSISLRIPMNGAKAMPARWWNICWPQARPTARQPPICRWSRTMPPRALYARYGFKDCYAYWYRLPAEQAAA